jgi:hypothetical protein
VSRAHEQSPGGTIVIDAWLKHHTYDGLGRLVRTRSPWPNPEAAGGAAGAPTHEGQANVEERAETFTYDGIRRLPEVTVTPSGAGPAELPRLVAAGDSASGDGGADVMYRVRNRDYLPRAGRWLERDPNATGMVVAIPVRTA